MATKWATDAEIASALVRWPRNMPDDEHVHQIMRETGLSQDTARLLLDIGRGDSEGDVQELTDAVPS